ncbi:MAG: hypothetical protein IJ480_08205 [Clostridia bacterium]|nr:hypothetical protein [Clostridia bacterium]
MRKSLIAVLMLIFLVLTGCGTDNTLAIEDFEWTFSHMQTEDGTVTFCKGTFLDTFPNATPATVTLTPAETEGVYELFFQNQYTGEKETGRYSLTLLEADRHNACYTVTLEGDTLELGQAVVNSRELHLPILTSTFVFTISAP